MRRAHVLMAAGAVAAAAGLFAGLREDRLPSANGATLQPPADSLAADLIAGVRGLDPVACELAARAMHRNWGRGGPGEPASSDDPRVLAIIDWAMNEGGPGAVPVLGAALADPDPCARRIAAIRLGRVNDPAATRRLREALEGADPGQREVAALGLGVAEDDAALPALVQALESDASPRVRRAAAWALGEMN